MVEVWDESKDEKVVLMAEKVPIGRVTEPCRKAIEWLASSVGASTEEVLVTVSAYATDDVKGLGFGTLVYETAAREAASRGLLLAADDCQGGGRTSLDAMRVWRSLRRSFLHHGDVLWGGRVASVARVAARFKKKQVDKADG